MTDARLLETVYGYHDRTKHQLNRYARSLGYMDWATQPNPFRRFPGAPLCRLDLPAEREAPTYDSLFSGALPAARPLTARSLAELLYFSLALSAWKVVRTPDGRVQARWSLRVDPSSGNLHPTEGYLVCGPVDGLADTPAVYHYAPFEHGLELRRKLDAGWWRRAEEALGPGGLLVGLSSIYWREAWKYGERAFRYSNHDVGHAIGAVTLSAACLGWQARLIDSVSTRQLGALLGTDQQDGIEAEHPDCLLALTPGRCDAGALADLLADVPGEAWMGEPNQLSGGHHAWPVIDDVSVAVESAGLRHDRNEAATLALVQPDRGLSAHRIIRQRRSAVAMDGKTRLSREAFFRLLQRLAPQAVPFATLPWTPAVSLLLFVHRVDGVEPGLYMLVRHPGHEASLRESCHAEFPWRPVEGAPDGVRLFLLAPPEVRHGARTVSCHQDIAADGVFAAAMLARFDAALESGGPAMYPRLFWETGLIGQMLYLEGEAAGLRGTGIGCFFDDAVHEILGIAGHAWQSLYHFTVGGPVDDPRLETAGAYEHLILRSEHGERAWEEA